MKNKEERIKLNVPCVICDEELFLGQPMVSFGESGNTPVHLECYNQHRAEKIEEAIDSFCFSDDREDNILIKRELKTIIKKIIQ